MKTFKNGDYHFNPFGKRQRRNGPSLVTTNGTECYYYNGKGKENLRLSICRNGDIMIESSAEWIVKKL